MASGWKSLSPLLTLLILSPLVTLWAQSPMAPLTVVVYNSLDASSQDLAQFYAAKRGIPEPNLVGLPLPPEEVISRETFNRQLAQPFTDRMVKGGFWKMKGREVIQSKVRYVVLMRGVPLKVSSTLPALEPGEKRDPVRDRDEASVDSELAALGFASLEGGFVENPYYRRFTPAPDADLPAGMLLVTRLDAPDEITVRAMIQDSLRAEERGLWGWAYVDLRGITSGAYAEGDRWLSATTDQLRKKGIPVISDRSPDLFPAGFPITQAALYYGWYAGQASGAFGNGAQLLPGSIAIHIHSFSAASLRDPTRYWAAPLLVQGAAVTAGNVYEPYLALTLHLDTFQDRLMVGMNVADAAYMATPMLSWMAVVIGDPLYRPYATWNDLAAPALGTSSEIWIRYREIINKCQGSVLLASLALKKLATSTQNSMPLESLGNAERDAGEVPPALATFEQAARIAPPGSPERLRLNLELIRLLRSRPDRLPALRLIASTLAEEKSPAGQKLLQTWQASLMPKPSPSP